MIPRVFAETGVPLTAFRRKDNDMTTTIRNLIIAAGLVATTWVGIIAAAPSPSTTSPQTSDEALRELMAGNERFVRGAMKPRDLMAGVKATAGGQSPFAIVVGCLDSRVAPELVFDQGIGDIFVARVAGNFVNTDIIGSLEFGTKLVGSKLIVVLGHTDCGAVKGACDDARLGILTSTLSNIMPAVHSVDTDGDRSSGNAAFVQHVADANVKMAVSALTDRSAVMNDLVKRGELKIVGAMYDIATGRVTFMD